MAQGSRPGSPHVDMRPGSELGVATFDRTLTDDQWHLGTVSAVLRQLAELTPGVRGLSL
jgi:hypothetical protein